MKTLIDPKRLPEEKEVRYFKKNETVYVKGNYSKWIYYINKGKLKTYHSNEEGKELITGLYKEGDFCGYLTFSEDENNKYADSAMTFEDSELYLFSKEDFFSLVYKNSEESGKFIRLLTNNLQKKEQQLIKLAYNSVRKRVAESLVTLLNCYKKEDEYVFTLNISRGTLSSISGIAKESVSRTLTEFKDENLIGVNGGIITILDLDRLSKICN